MRSLNFNNDRQTIPNNPRALYASSAYAADNAAQTVKRDNPRNAEREYRETVIAQRAHRACQRRPLPARRTLDVLAFVVHFATAIALAVTLGAIV